MVVNSNLPGLAPDCERVALFHVEHIAEYKHEFRQVELPRILPAPKPTQTASGNPLIPDFTRTEQPYWADETTHQDNEPAND